MSKQPCICQMQWRSLYSYWPKANSISKIVMAFSLFVEGRMKNIILDTQVAKVQYWCRALSVSMVLCLQFARIVEFIYLSKSSCVNTSCPSLTEIWVIITSSCRIMPLFTHLAMLRGFVESRYFRFWLACSITRSTSDSKYVALHQATAAQL